MTQVRIHAASMGSCSRGEPMGLLDKHNPRATRQSVLRAACLGAIGFFVFALVMLLASDIPYWGWPFMLPFMTAFGAISGAALEWQLNEEDDSDPPDPDASIREKSGCNPPSTPR